MSMSSNLPIAADITMKEMDTASLTILGFGSLLSEKSARLTFPELNGFRLGRVPNYRRVFSHPTAIFFQRGIADRSTLEMSSLSVEYVDREYPGFVCTVFEVSNKDMMEDGIPSLAFLEREEEFNIVQVPYVPLDFVEESSVVSSYGLICERSTDESFIERWGSARFDDHFGRYGVYTIWNWSNDSGLRPCAVYLRHCYLAAESLGQQCFDSFLDETFLIDRTTTVRQYLLQNPSVLDKLPPAHLSDRYNG